MPDICRLLICNLQTVISEIEQKAKNRNVINYFQNGKYIGNFVITDFNVNIRQKTGNAILYAEIEINLLEKTENSTQNTLIQSVLVNSAVMRNFLVKAEKISLENIFDKNKKSSAGQLMTKLKTSLIDEIQKNGLSDAVNITNKYLNSVNLSEQNKQELSAVPKRLVNTALRQII